jgi:hypothetical protein
MTKLITAIAVATGVLIMPNTSLAAGLVGAMASVENAGQIIQIKETRRRKPGRSRNQRHNRHNRNAGGHFYFGPDFFDGHIYRACRQLKRKARYTGSRYWWNQYRRCMDHRYF